ncbi:hypothetical protein EVAR_76470_1 [Eumeta japonica]|uniref:Uncharacterized protein n=1 Tax=Eumeta variegata TaxID=151549 RepID=A0A4C1T813_EUMVA|nr:hypothetical protein EVAR_76470_1 [Eumeta japonica]
MELTSCQVGSLYDSNKDGARELRMHTVSHSSLVSLGSATEPETVSTTCAVKTKRNNITDIENDGIPTQAFVSNVAHFAVSVCRSERSTLNSCATWLLTSRHRSGAQGMLWRGDDVRGAAFDRVARNFHGRAVVTFRTVSNAVEIIGYQ